MVRFAGLSAPDSVAHTVADVNWYLQVDTHRRVKRSGQQLFRQAHRFAECQNTGPDFGENLARAPLKWGLSCLKRFDSSLMTSPRRTRDLLPLLKLDRLRPQGPWLQAWKRLRAARIEGTARRRIERSGTSTPATGRTRLLPVIRKSGWRRAACGWRCGAEHFTLVAINAAEVHHANAVGDVMHLPAGCAR